MQAKGLTQSTRLLLSNSSTKAPTRTGFAQTLLNFALESPLWKYILVPQARSTMVKTAEANGIPWNTAKSWIKSHIPEEPIDTYTQQFPTFYRKPFHAYEQGNLCWDAAWEVEIASCAVGARNFPQFGSKGEDAFRTAFDVALQGAGAVVPTDAMMLDMGCGTGMSTRRMARNYPQAKSILGIDLSPYFIKVGLKLLELAPVKSFHEGGPWVSSILPDDRIEYSISNAADTSLDNEIFDVVNVQFVLHELPLEISKNLIDEAYRLLKPKGQLWICEMDFEAPAYAAQRANALLFSLIRSTEPYLDEYAESISSLFDYICEKFTMTTVSPATGRHFALVATKNDSKSWSFNDLRFDADGKYRVEDTHLQLWESKHIDSQ